MERKYIDTSESDEFANDTVCTECYSGTIAEMNCNDGKWRCEECADKWVKAESIESLQTQLTQEREKLKGLMFDLRLVTVTYDNEHALCKWSDIQELIQKYKTDEQTR